MTHAPAPAASEFIRRVTGQAPLRIQPLASGGNNRVFKVQAGSDQWLLKEYFRHTADTRDRLGAEYSFLKFAWDHGVRCIPQPLGFDADNAIGLYEFIRGRRLTVGDVGSETVAAALRFWQDVNSAKGSEDALLLPNASEACFTMTEHLECLRRRADALRSLQGDSGIQSEAREFVLSSLIPASETICSGAASRVEQAALRMDHPLDLSEKCISPSDFGFHNALIDESGALRFVDFEYAGWDDPAKMSCDFFCQPALPVPEQHEPEFLSKVAAMVDRPEDFVRRAHILMPVYRLKWCCIMLNDFLPVGGKRRRFAREGNSADDYQAGQLQKAKVALAQALEQSD